jgi:hypothetical protein
MDLKESFVPVASALAAILGIVNTWQNNTANHEIEKLKTQLIQRDYQRKFASEIMQRFDSVVTAKEQDRPTRISRLEGLQALAGLFDRSEDAAALDTKGILAVIQGQARAYAQEIEIASRTATPEEAEVLSSQLVRVSAVENSASKALDKIETKEVAEARKTGGSTAAAPSQAAQAKRSVLDGMRVDIFWCSGVDNAAENLRAATRLAESRPPTSQREWRVKPLAPEVNARPSYQVRQPQVRVDAPAERVAARQLNALARNAGFNFAEKQAGQTNSVGIISAFICQPESTA